VNRKIYLSNEKEKLGSFQSTADRIQKAIGSALVVLGANDNLV
jgi:hypothetical protein